MNVLLIASRYYPIFNKENRGAIEKLDRIYLEYNEKTNDHFTIYSPKIAADNYDHPNLTNSTFRIIDKTTIRYKIPQYYHALKRRILRQPNSELYIRIIARDIIKRGEQNKYDLIIFENGVQDIPVFRKITKTKTRIALHLHTDYLNQETKNKKEIMDSVDEVWPVSKFLAQQVNKIKKIKTIVIPNAVDMNRVKINKNIVKKLSNEFGAGDNKIFIFAGRLLKIKGIAQLIEAFNKYNSNEPKSKLLIAGSTEKNLEGIEIGRILKKACSNNQNIVCLGYLDPRDLINYRAIADCQIVPSICEEAFGLVILEAMLANIKIIASRVGGIPEVGEDRIIYVNRDKIVKDLVKSMKAIEKVKKLPDQYYEEQIKKYTMDNYCQNVYDAIHEKSIIAKEPNGMAKKRHDNKY